MSEKLIYRQGDVLLIEASLPEDEAREVARENDSQLILASGEVTGHHHLIAEPEARLWEFADGSRYLRVDSPVYLRHQEHSPIELPPRIFRVIIQREYVPGPVVQYRDVAD